MLLIGVLVEMAFERVQAAGPVRSIWAEPRVQLGQRLGAEVVDAPLGVDADIDEAGVAQHAQVPGDAGLMHARDLHELADGTVVLADMVEDAPSCRFGDHLQDVELRNHGGQYMSTHIYVKRNMRSAVARLFAADTSTNHGQCVCRRFGAQSLRQTLRPPHSNVSAANPVPGALMGHSMHGQDPQRYADTLTEWAVGLSS